jgi:hypothetical protein
MQKILLSVLILSYNCLAVDIIDIFGDQSSSETGFGSWVDASYDMNRDGVNDFVYYYQNGTSSEIRIRSGANGSMLAQIPVNSEYGSFSTSIGDMNGDGYLDIAIGVPYYDSSSKDDVGLVYVVSGSDQSILFQKEGTVEWGEFGWMLAFNDFNGDGISELLSFYEGTAATELFEVFTSDGSKLCGGNLPPQFSGRPITSVIGRVNPNQDGVLDFAIGAFGYGTDGAVLFF